MKKSNNKRKHLTNKSTQSMNRKCSSNKSRRYSNESEIQPFTMKTRSMVRREQQLKDQTNSPNES